MKKYHYNDEDPELLLSLKFSPLNRSREEGIINSTSDQRNKTKPGTSDRRIMNPTTNCSHE